MQKFSLFLFVMLAGQGAWADSNQIQLGVPQTGGNGCKPGTVSATLSPDGNALSVIFDQLSVKAGLSAGERKDQVQCALTVPMQIPAGYSVAVTQFDFRGYHYLPARSHNHIKADFGIGGNHGHHGIASFNEMFKGPLDQEFDLSQKLDSVWSGCGEQTNLVIDVRMDLMTHPKSKDDAFSGIDSLDVASKTLTYQLILKKCTP